MTVTDTFDRLARANPDRVGRVGMYAELDGYQVAVIDINVDATFTWTLRFADRHVASGSAIGLVGAWRAGCDALDAHKTAVA